MSSKKKKKKIKYFTENIDDILEIKTKWLFIKDYKIQTEDLSNINEISKKSPLIEVSSSYHTNKSWNIFQLTNLEINQLLLTYYNFIIDRELFFPGNYGDWIKCSIISLNAYNFQVLNLDLIGNAAWNKPTVASDLGIFIKSGEKYFFVGIIRKNPPGKGQPAIIGGIMNSGKIFDSSIYTMIKETKEEVNLSIKYEGDINELRENYNIRVIPVKIHGFENITHSLSTIDANILYVSTEATTEQERLLNGTKRVYSTTGYSVLIDLKDIEIEIDQLDQVFTAGDDASKMVFHDVSRCFLKDDFSNIPRFGLDHHYILFKKMVEKIKNTSDT